MNLNQLYYLRAIARAKGLTRAAESLHVTQSNLSHSMTALETELGIPLFYKDGRNILLTPYGEEFLQYVQQSLEALEQGIQVAQSRCSPIRGLVRLSTISALSNAFIPRCVSEFGAIEENRLISFSLEEKPTRKIVRDFSRHTVDIGFGTRFAENGFIFHPVAWEELVAIVPKGHPLAGGDSVTLSDLAGEQLVTYNQFSPTRSLILTMFREQGLTPHISFEATTDQMLASAGATEIDLLVTWLYRLTQDLSNYRMAAVIGMLVFAVCSLLTLTAFRRLNRNNREESFQ